MKIIVDAMGGDNSPSEVVKGALMAVEKLGVQIILVGDKNKIDLPQNDKISLVHTEEIIDCDDDPVNSIRTKKDSSIVVGLKLLADKKGDAFVSAGSTGAVISGATLIVKRIKGIRRAALGAIIPTKKGYTLLIDGGANADCTEEFLQQFAIMGNAYAKALMGIDNPKIGLLNNGVEETKGNEVSKKAHALLKEMPINFIGNIEAREVLNGVTDVLVTDGFSGNVFIKTTEGTAKFFAGLIKEMLTKNIFTKICALILSKGIKNMKDILNSDKFGGVPVLGVNGVVIKAHGSSKDEAFYNAIRQASEFAKKDVVGAIESNI
ncbi:MAG: phosphate acyltransferase PlsX [Clostridia bacterium]|nr:phosphate acyltransferase PlsX [Clostridia bacterium]